jgi:dTDP-4-dehydrorhamnose reductase
MKILITGANGQLAQEFQRLLETSHHKTVSLDKKGLDIVDLDSIKNVFEHHHPEVVLNCASYNFVDSAEEDFDTAYKVNALGVRNLAFVCRSNNALLVHYSSDYVFDGTKEDFYTEHDEPNPINSYGKTKLLGENFLRDEYDKFILFRVSWVYGDGKQNFLYKLLEWAKKNRVLKIVYDQISVPTCTRNIANLTMFAIDKGLRGLYHLTDKGYASRYEVARYFLERLGLNNLVLPVSSDVFPSPAKRPFFSVMSHQKLSEDLNVDIPFWKVGIERYVETVFEREEI